MKKKLIPIAAVLATLSAVFASPASASPVLTENAAAVPVGATVQATNVGEPLITTPLGTTRCINTKMHGNVIANTGTQIEIEFGSVTFFGCSGPFVNSVEAKNLPWCWKASSKMTADTFELRGGKCSEAAKPLTLLANSCPYTRTVLTGPFNTAPQDVSMTVAQEFTRESGSLCPTPIEPEIVYTLETATGENSPLVIS